MTCTWLRLGNLSAHVGVSEEIVNNLEIAPFSAIIILVIIIKYTFPHLVFIYLSKRNEACQVWHLRVTWPGVTADSQQACHTVNLSCRVFVGSSRCLSMQALSPPVFSVKRWKSVQQIINRLYIFFSEEIRNTGFVVGIELFCIYIYTYKYIDEFDLYKFVLLVWTCMHHLRLVWKHRCLVWTRGAQILCTACLLFSLRSMNVFCFALCKCGGSTYGEFSFIPRTCT